MDVTQIIALTAFLASAAALSIPTETKPISITRRDADFNWTAITPSTELEYHDCFDGFQCARLQVPLDWNNTGVTDNAAIAIARLPAQVPVTDPRYGGPVLLNPGGPGESGVAELLSLGQAIQVVFDAAFADGSPEYVSNNSNARYFDIIGFDPRGVNNSTPFLSCFSTMNEAISWVHEGKSGLVGTQLGTPEGPFDQLWETQGAVGPSCYQGPAITPNGSRIADFMGTTSAARDMVEIVERHAEWREKQSTDPAVIQRIKHIPGEVPINYYGVSYGTLLGATLAAMQPHRVGRFILDGVVSAEQYYAIDLTTDDLSVDHLFQNVFGYCAAAGRDICPLAVGNSSADVQRAIEGIYQDFTANGPVVVADGNGGNITVTLSNIKTALGRAPYTPLANFPVLATVIAPLIQRNGTAFATFLAETDDTPRLPDTQLNALINAYDPATGPSHLMPTADNPGWAIIGADSTFRPTKAQFREIWQNLRTNITVWSGDWYATRAMPTYEWPAVNKWRFHDTHPIASNVTKNPILFVNNLWDPATSVYSAKKMQQAFAGSGLLINEGEGHIVTASAPGFCAVQKIREYMQTGMIPAGLDKHCLPYERVFLGSAGPNTAPFDLVGATLEDQVLYNASMALIQ